MNFNGLLAALWPLTHVPPPLDVEGEVQVQNRVVGLTVVPQYASVTVISQDGRIEVIE